MEGGSLLRHALPVNPTLSPTLSRLALAVNSFLLSAQNPQREPQGYRRCSPCIRNPPLEAELGGRPVSIYLFLKAKSFAPSECI